MTNCPFKTHIFDLTLFFSPSLSNSLEFYCLAIDPQINDIQLSFTNILYFVVIFIEELNFDSCMPPVFS